MGSERLRNAGLAISANGWRPNQHGRDSAGSGAAAHVGAVAMTVWAPDRTDSACSVLVHSAVRPGRRHLGSSREDLPEGPSPGTGTRVRRLDGVQYGESCKARASLVRRTNCRPRLFLERHVRAERVPPDDPSAVYPEHGSLTHLALAELDGRVLLDQVQRGGRRREEELLRRGADPQRPAHPAGKQSSSRPSSSQAVAIEPTSRSSA